MLILKYIIVILYYIYSVFITKNGGNLRPILWTAIIWVGILGNSISNANEEILIRRIHARFLVEVVLFSFTDSSKTTQLEIFPG